MQQEELLNQLINFDFSNPDKRIDIPNGLKLYKGNSELIFIASVLLPSLYKLKKKKNKANPIKIEPAITPF